MTDGGKGYILSLGPRRNHLLRPPLANLDQLVLVSSCAQPAPNLAVLDRMIAICEKKEIAPILVFTKGDLGDTAAAGPSIYQDAGIQTVQVCSLTGEGVEEVKTLLKGKVSAFTGNSGVGKSTLLNAIDPRLGLQTADISLKLGTRTAYHPSCGTISAAGGWMGCGYTGFFRDGLPAL